MVGVRMREDDRGRSNGMQTMQPVRAAVDHDACVILLDKQRAVTSMPTRADVDFGPRSKKCQLHFLRCFAAALDLRSEPDGPQALDCRPLWRKHPASARVVMLIQTARSACCSMTPA